MDRQPILIVDDNPANLKLARILLESEGYEIRTAVDADEVQQVIESFRPVLILMDIQLPRVDGLELTRRLKRDPRFEGVKIVALTAFAMQDDENRALEAGCDGYITKPMDTRSLAAQVAELLRGE